MLTEEKDNLIQVQSSCPMCEKVHDDLDVCYSYKKMEVGDEKEVSEEPISKGHSGRNCPRRTSCCLCKENHSTGLHGYKPKSKESVAGRSQSSEGK